MSDFPTCADELTLSWLQNQLSQTFPNSMLEGFSLETIGVGQGFMGQLVRIQLEFQERRSGLPDTIIAKFASAKIETRELAAKMNYYGRSASIRTSTRKPVSLFQNPLPLITMQPTVTLYCSLKTSRQQLSRIRLKGTQRPSRSRLSLHLPDSTVTGGTARPYSKLHGPSR